MNAQTERWAVVDGFPSYEVSSLGAVRSLETGAIRKQPIHWKGYPVIGLMKDGVRSTHSVHRLVARAFIPNDERKPTVNHKNGIKTDNRAENLEWVTVRENNEHAGRIGLMAHGESHTRAKHSDEAIAKMRKLHSEGCTISRLADFFGMSRSGIGKIISGANRRINHA